MNLADARKLKAKLDEGDWVPVPSPYFKALQLLVVPGASMATTTRLQELTRAYRAKNRIKEGKELPVEDAIRLAFQANVGRKVKGWRGIEDENGDVLAFNEENFVTVVMEFELWVEVSRILNSDEAFEAQAQEELKGN